ncbi:putative bifunctional diguanylate cyclase/phosphodiesterase [Motiliproteus sediminis]|uniref:putative bifunctional diguanylate cyclase/phosphodiesterase n=1 Tax=Motiliproteus sediminis TaxID=1468178 RepID=UPI001AEFCB10|nr:bifunctional diguanylate cyclase/phosphodiesterase [Motiliproteus sediminis]
MDRQDSIASLWKKSQAKTFAGSSLVRLMVTVILVLWGLNINSLVTDYQQRTEQRISEHQQRLLDGKRDEIERLLGAVYEHTRTISLLPSIRNVEGGNRPNADANVVAEGRLPLGTHQTIQQIYKNLAHSIRLSEIYYILDGFQPDQGEVPFFMYDGEIVGINSIIGADQHEDVPEEYELDEYRHYVKQLAWFEQHYPSWSFSNDITQVPAISSPLMRTCDNSQYGSTSEDDVRDTYGLLYSVPVFDLDTQQFKGMISAVLRANVLEALLVGRPFVPVTPEDKAAASAAGWRLPEQPTGFLLTQDTHGIRIADRRHGFLSGADDNALDQSDGRVTTLVLDIVSDGQWQLHHYLSPAQIEALTAPLRQELFVGISARVGLLALLLAIFIKANRDQQRHHQELIRLAHYDSVTALPNRALMYRQLQQSMARADRHKNRLGLMFVDIDDFGAINDTLGHTVGDRVLMAIADRLRSSIRLSDGLGLRDGDNDLPAVARLGGDDFAIIFEDLSQAEDGVLLGERTLLRFNDPITLDGERVEISLSGGMSIYPDDAREVDELMAAADYALRHASSEGVGLFQMFNDEMRKKAARQTRLLRDLPAAIRHQLFELYYQPKQSLDDDRIVSFEALIRWQHEEYGFISPMEFIPLLEQSGLIVDVGRWVMETACLQLKQWQTEGNDELCVSVNVSPRQLMLSDIVATVDEVLAGTGVAPHTLILEITESMLIDNLDDGKRTLERIKSLGVKLAIDDFGTGYSSLTYLQGLPVDYLKLDKSMIDVIDDPKGAHVIRSTIQLAHGLGLRAIAEGVEHKEQREALKRMQCDLIQGYWLSRPLPVDQCGVFLGPRIKQA